VVPYDEATAIQEQLRARRLTGELPDVMLLLEHPPTYTRGRRSAADELPRGDQISRRSGIAVMPTDRGGRVTYHGPGQLVGYPIVAVEDVVGHVRRIEAALVAALADEGLRARSRATEGQDYTGVWVQERKIASIGVHVSRGVATHGFAVNVDNDLEPFSWIVPCGLSGVAMTSIAQERTRATSAHPQPTASLAVFRARVEERFGEALGASVRAVAPAELGLAASTLRAQPATARIPVHA
jgi:lipoyl(octanoyl) transferase